MSEHSAPDLESRLKAKLAEAEKYAASIREDIAALVKKSDDPDDVAERKMQHEAVNHLDEYERQTHVHWHTVLEFLEDAIAELRAGHEDADAAADDREAASTSAASGAESSTAEKAPSVQTAPRTDSDTVDHDDTQEP
ncbi:hypothetical protein [Corynebacterium sp. 19B]|uniref:hypothetical protein n=1 Tax=Corynebacterium sp. 19B TaxID=2080508 RepID=UPI00124F0C5B|nr:hypothetical protein [Corynebacterium sp. 19B]